MSRAWPPAALIWAAPQVWSVSEARSPGKGRLPLQPRLRRQLLTRLRRGTTETTTTVTWFDSSVKLEIKLLGNSKTRRKDVKCFSFEMVVDSDRTNFNDSVESVVEKYPPRYMEVPHIQYYDEALKSFPEIKSDQDLMCMFSKHRNSKVIIMFIVYQGPSDPYAPVTKWDFNVDSQPKNNIELDEDDYLRNPAPQNEHVGVDEEAMGPPKKMAKSALSSIVPLEDDAPAASISFPPSQSLEISRLWEN
ncbi:unnamed protein product [Miscanthus lutarioriparius]|uniref:Uncharacterized protein n=1 Tax=Miscanthus lutarioriparius TaxID=422564 RepID=A0A811QYB3_9POAL|nr:unnamed protein product [Miscanthus lutarioriparius]